MGGKDSGRRIGQCRMGVLTARTVSKIRVSPTNVTRHRNLYATFRHPRITARLYVKETTLLQVVVKFLGVSQTVMTSLRRQQRAGSLGLAAPLGLRQLLLGQSVAGGGWRRSGRFCRVYAPVVSVGQPRQPVDHSFAGRESTRRRESGRPPTPTPSEGPERSRERTRAASGNPPHPRPPVDGPASRRAG